MQGAKQREILESFMGVRSFLMRLTCRRFPYPKNIADLYQDTFRRVRERPGLLSALVGEGLSDDYRK